MVVAQHFSGGTVHVAAGFHIIGTPTLTLSPRPHRLLSTPLSRLPADHRPHSLQFPVLRSRSSWVLECLRGGGHLWEWVGSGEFSMEVGGWGMRGGRDRGHALLPGWVPTSYLNDGRVWESVGDNGAACSLGPGTLEGSRGSQVVRQLEGGGVEMP